MNGILASGEPRARPGPCEPVADALFGERDALFEQRQLDLVVVVRDRRIRTARSSARLLGSWRESKRRRRRPARRQSRACFPIFVAKLCPRAELLPRLAELRAAGRLHQRRLRHPAPRPCHLPGAGARARREPRARPEQRRLGARPRQGARPAAEQRGRPRLRARRAGERQPGDPLRRGDAARAAEARAGPTCTSRAATTTSSRSPRRRWCAAGAATRERCRSSTATRRRRWWRGSGADPAARPQATRGAAGWHDRRPSPACLATRCRRAGAEPLALAPGRGRRLRARPRGEPRRFGRALLQQVREQFLALTAAPAAPIRPSG